MQNSSNKILQILGGFIAFGFGLLQGIDWLFTKYEIGNFYFNIILILLLLGFIVSIVITFKKNRNVNNNTKKQTSKVKLVIGTFLSLMLVSLFVYFFKKINDNDSLINEKIPEIIKLFDEGKVNMVFLETKKLIEDYPKNEILKNYFEKSSQFAYLKTDTNGVEVSIKYSGDSIFNFIGTTPIDSFPVPRNRRSHVLKLKYEGREYIQNSKLYHDYFLPDSKINVPENHKVFLGANSWMFLQGVNFDNVKIAPFSISKNEVSNEDFQDFVDNGGYENPLYWDFPFQIGDKILDFNSTVKLFTDKFGKLGPANWSYGKYPSGLENHPVTGISWFEAKAYANYKKMSLPNIFQWLYASGLPEDWFEINRSVTNESNYNSTQTRAVDNSGGSYNELNNIGGNVKEWTLNPNGKEKEKFSILGGSFSEQPYTFNNYYSLSPMDRSIGNGIRLSQNLNTSKNLEQNNFIVEQFERNIIDLPDVSDELFEFYKTQFDYDKSSINATTTNILNFQEGYTAQKFELETTYDSEEKLFGYIVYSNKFKDKYDPVIYFPNASSITNNNDSNLYQDMFGMKHLVDEGYAIIHPIYHNTYSRQKTYNTFWPDQSENYKSTIIKIGQDFKRSIDYIDSRSDFNIENLSYFGYSWGSTTSNYLLAIDDRVKSAFLCVGGVMSQKSKPEVEAHYYLRRIKTPIFHVIGKLDGIFGYEKSYKPWKSLIGTDPKNLKTLELNDFGHGIPWDTIIKYQANWYKQFSVK